MADGRATRREFVATVTAAAIALPILGQSVARAAGDNWVSTVKPADLAAGYTMYKRSNFVLSRVGDKAIALDITCTHKACEIKPGVDKKDKDKNLLVCPCHGGRFDQEGNVVSGPPKEPLARHAIRLSESGVIEVNAGVKIAAGSVDGVLAVK